MVEYTNFFETKKEAEMRLKGTIVLYDNDPYYVLCISDHKPDGIFRIYMDPVSSQCMAHMTHSLPGYNDEYPEGTSLGAAYDTFLEKTKDTKIVRKMMNSPKFDKFRPFPLGMINTHSGVVFTERQPTRKTEQGLTQNMITASPIDLSVQTSGRSRPQAHFNFISDEFKACIKGDYPSAHSCIAALRNPKVLNNAGAFHRLFAFVRGPLNTLYLGYRDKVIGFLPDNNLSTLILGKEFEYTKEVVQELHLFGRIEVQST